MLQKGGDYTPEALEAHRELLFGTTVGIGDRNAIPAGVRAPSAKAAGACMHMLLLTCPVPACCTALHQRRLHVRMLASTKSPMPACCAALHRHRMQERVPFDQSLHAGLDELELVAYATVSDALRAARVEPSEVDILTTLLGATDACSQHDLTPCVT